EGEPTRSCHLRRRYAAEVKYVSGEGYEFLGEAGQHLRPAGLADDDEVLDPDAAAARQVDARLDARDVADGQNLRRLGREPRQFVHVHADAVTQAVPEVRAEALRLDDVASGGVGIEPADAGAHGIEPGQLRAQADDVSLPQLALEVPGRERPG